MDRIDELAQELTNLPGIGPRQAKRFVYYLLGIPVVERARLAELINILSKDVHQCPGCQRFYNNTSAIICGYCSSMDRDDGLLMLVEKDQDLGAIERAGTYLGRYFVLGGVLTLSGNGTIRKKELIRTVEEKLKSGLKEVVLALSATSEGEYTADRVRELLQPYRDLLIISVLGRGLSTGSELEYSDADTLRAALSSRKKT